MEEIGLEIPKLTIAVDVDGVLAEQVIPVLKIVEKKYGISLQKADITAWEFPIGSSDIKTEIILAETDEQYIKSMAPMKDASNTIAELSKNYNIVIATSRNPISDEWTKEWLSKNKITYNDYFNTSSHGKNLPSANILIDDYIKNIEDFISLQINGRNEVDPISWTTRGSN